ncbi:MAG: disease resistance protein [Capsulimonas sp.]|jgi:hypothetical protein|nr:disease resistance protein [Capsulimonas sp.]
MQSIPSEPEFQRLRKDFETEASKYHDLTLSTYFFIEGAPAPEMKVGEKHHAISLWQYVDSLLPNGNLGRLENIKTTNFGLEDSLINAIGVINGPETDKFRRMAKRAGSLLPKSVVQDITIQIMKNVVNPEWKGKPVYVCNGDPLAAWLNLVLVCISNYQPNRFSHPTIAVDPYTASLTVFDYVISGQVNDRMKDTNNPTALASTRFKVALSFPGEQRKYVEKVALILREQIGEVFYDNFFEAELARPNLDTLLQTIYRSNSDLVVVFLCEEYEQKEWCGLEWRAIRDLMKCRKSDSIMFMRFDDAVVSGVFSIDGYIDLRKRTTQQAAMLIIERLKSN